MSKLGSTPRIPVNALQILLKQCYSTPACLIKPPTRRRYAVNPIPAPNIDDGVKPGPSTPPQGASVAVLGGGITGLACTYYLSRSRPDLQITLFESSERLGGWLHSTSVDVGTGKVIFEQGPRNLRPTSPNGLITLDLVDMLGLEDRLLMTSQSSPAAQNRFIYYPDHLVRMPGPGASLLANFQNVLSESIFNGSISGALSEVTKPKRSAQLRDESIGSFISRRFGSALADNIVSAVFHGIYAGDIYKLSARAILPGLWHSEQRNRSILSSIFDQMMGGLRPIAQDDADAISLRKYDDQPVSEARAAASKSSVFTFKGGVGELADRLEQRLVEAENVHIQKGTLIKDISMTGHGRYSKMELLSSSNNTPTGKNTALWDFSHVISTIPGSVLAGLVSDSTPLLPLFQTKAVTVMVVNLFYANPSVVPVQGFGYLLPRSLPFEQNPERALGVVFDSDASVGQDAVPGTKLTVMIGGHWWDDFDTYPDEAEGAAMAQRILRRHLGIVAAPDAVRVGLHRSCIPQYEVGHEQRMEQASKDLEVFEGRLRVAGNSYTGVGLNDCVRAARDVVRGLVQGTRRTGLEGFVGGRKWIWVEPGSLR